MENTRIVLLVILSIVACGVGVGTTGCAPGGGSTGNVSPQWPQLSAPTKIEPGVLLYEATLTRGTTPVRVWIYLPEVHAKSIPAILIAPAGSPLLYGMSLGAGDRPEHLPYVREGFAVIAYEIEGAVPQRAPWSEAIAGAKAFESAGYGVADARLALDFALAHVPEIDRTKVISAGHSSAATLSLLVAAGEPRIRGCIAYAPVCDVGLHLSAETLAVFSQMYPNAQSFFSNSSPVNHIEELHCSVFLFHADDDRVVPAGVVVDFAERLKRSNPNVTLVTVPGGGHYDSMINEGIPAAIRWAKTLTAFPAAPKP